jgi:hypothetical protein
MRLLVNAAILAGLIYLCCERSLMSDFSRWVT